MSPDDPMTAHRRGARVTYLPALQCPTTPWPEVIDVTQSAAQLSAASEAALISTRCRADEHSQPRLHTHPVHDLRGCRIYLLGDVRRPSSYKGMKNSIGRMRLPTLASEPHSGWFESRNEQENYRELVMRRPVVDMRTQCLRLEWPINGGVRSHVPDAVYRTSDGSITLLDVTRQKRLEDPTALAIFLLTRATAAAMGWGYEVRVEMTPQHQRNVSFVYSHRHAPDQLASDWFERLCQIPPSLQLRDAAVALGTPESPAYAAVFHLVATRRLFMDLTQPLTLDVLVRTRPLPTRRPSCLPAR